MPERPKAIIHFFSGTGNTHRAASLIAGELERQGFISNMASVECGHPDAAKADLHVFAFPVYAFAPPAAMLKYTRALPPGEGVRTAILAVHGEVNASGMPPGYEGQALAQARRMLARRGYDVAVTGTAGYPVSFLQVAGAPHPQEQAGILSKGDAKVAGFVQRILSGERSLKKADPISLLLGPLLWLVFTAIGRRLLGKLFVTDHSCNGCGRCAAACPSGTIRMHGRTPRWGYRCEACQRCINICPQAAIQTSLFRLAMLIAPCFFPYGFCLRAALHLSLAPLFRVPFDALARVTGYLLVTYTLDLFLYGLQTVPVIRRVLRANVTHRYRRYLAPGFDPLKTSGGKPMA